MRNALHKTLQFGIVTALIGLWIGSPAMASEPCTGSCQEPAPARTETAAEEGGSTPTRNTTSSQEEKPSETPGEDPDIDEVEPDPLVCGPSWIGGLLSLVPLVGCR